MYNIHQQLNHKKHDKPLKKKITISKKKELTFLQKNKINRKKNKKKIKTKK